jgi:hypothetical protein
MRESGAVLGRKFKGQGITLDNWKRFVLEFEDRSQATKRTDFSERTEIQGTIKSSRNNESVEPQK